MTTPDNPAPGTASWRATLTQACLWIAVLVYAVALGGNVFQMIVVDPIWSGSPPASLQTYFGELHGYEALRRFHVNPFSAFAQLCLVASVALSWHDRALRRWLLPALILQVLIVLGTVFYVYPINEIIMVHAGREVSPELARELTQRWLFADHLRLGLKFVVFVCLLRGLQRAGVQSRPIAGA
jgi:hypothetical protein